MKEISSGVYPTMITPFKADNTIDFEAVYKIIEMYSKNNCDGVFAVCQSSEMFYLSTEEKISLAKNIVDYISQKGIKMNVVASGHTSDLLDEQAYELAAVHETGVDAVVLVSNRLAKQNESDKVWIKNAESLLKNLPSNISLGIYECPYPYKRLLSTEILNWCLSVNRFSFIKDTCCDPNLLNERLKILKDSNIKLFNANAQTLLYSLQHGCSGYSGVMANFHPFLYSWLCKNFQKYPQQAAMLGNILSMCAFTEVLSYPVTAKYHMNISGIKMDLNTRSRNASEITEYHKLVIRQMKELAENEELKLG